jgi:hypothetical protein
MMASGKEPTAPREGQAPAPREEGDSQRPAEAFGHAPEDALAEAEALRRRLAVTHAYLGIIG